MQIINRINFFLLLDTIEDTLRGIVWLKVLVGNRIGYLLFDKLGLFKEVNRQDVVDNQAKG